jgi:hypothetical protein
MASIERGECSVASIGGQSLYALRASWFKVSRATIERSIDQTKAYFGIGRVRARWVLSIFDICLRYFFECTPYCLRAKDKDAHRCPRRDERLNAESPRARRERAQIDYF